MLLQAIRRRVQGRRRPHCVGRGLQCISTPPNGNMAKRDAARAPASTSDEARTPSSRSFTLVLPGIGGVIDVVEDHMNRILLYANVASDMKA